MEKLKNKVVFITGGLSGIGKACAIAAAREGAEIVIADRERGLNIKGMDDIRELQPDAQFVECNVSMSEQVKEAIDQTINTFGSVDVALNNAGIGGKPARISEMEDSDWLDVINIDLNGVFYCIKQELIQMLKQKSGVIVNMSSISGKIGYPQSAHYVSAKHGIIGLTKTAALEYAADGIRVNVICPGFIDTPLLSKLDLEHNPERKKVITDRYPMKRFGTSEEVAKAFIFLATDDSSYITGTSLNIDGGCLSQ